MSHTIKHLSIVGKRWFQKSYGNTYHSVEVVVVTDDGETACLYNPFKYGYGEQYLQSAHELLVNAGLFAGDYSAFYSEFVVHYGTPAIRKASITCIDVSRKKDL